MTDWLHYKQAFDAPDPRSKKKHRLSKIYKASQREKVEDILDAENPGHYERLWCVGFLKYAGYSNEGIMNILKESSWASNERMTYLQVRSVKLRR